MNTKAKNSADQKLLNTWLSDHKKEMRRREKYDSEHKKLWDKIKHLHTSEFMG